MWSLIKFENSKFRFKITALLKTKKDSKRMIGDSPEFKHIQKNKIKKQMI